MFGKTSDHPADVQFLLILPMRKEGKQIIHISPSQIHFGCFSTKLALVLELVLLRILGTLVLFGEPVCVSTSFEQNYGDQRHVINRGRCIADRDL